MRRFWPALMVALVGAAPLVEAKILVLDTFDRAEPKNAFDGITGAWDLDPGDSSVSCKMSFDSAVRWGETGYSLRLDYDLESRRENVFIPTNESVFNPAEVRGEKVYNGYFSIFGPADLTAYRYLVLHLKGDAAGYTQAVRLELKDTQGLSGIQIKGITDQWQRFEIPLRRFTEIQDWSRMKEFVFVFGPDTVTERRGTLYVDDVYFATSPHEKLRLPPQRYGVRRDDRPSQLDGRLDDWRTESFFDMSNLKDFVEFGEAKKRKDIGARFAAAWDDKFLYLAIDVTDNEIVNRQAPKEIWKDDCVEIYLNPEGKLFTWGNPRHFQIGVSPASEAGRPVVWAWFQGRAPTVDEVRAAVQRDKRGYQVEAALAWTFLGVEPFVGKRISYSVAAHDRDQKDGTPEAKLNWSYEEIKGSGIRLGVFSLQ